MANLIKRIVKAQYETSDGQTFESKVDAMKHQADLDRVRKVMDLLTANLQFRTVGACDYLADSTTVNEVATFIVDNADALREILPKRAKSLVAEEPPVNDPATPLTAEEALLPYNPVLNGNGNVSDAALANA
jgi:hypothetical protein